MREPLTARVHRFENYILRERVHGQETMSTPAAASHANRRVLGEKRSTAAQPCVRRIFCDSQFFSRAENIRFHVIDNNLVT